MFKDTKKVLLFALIGVFLVFCWAQWVGAAESVVKPKRINPGINLMMGDCGLALDQKLGKPLAEKRHAILIKRCNMFLARWLDEIWADTASAKCTPIEALTHIKMLQVILAFVPKHPELHHLDGSVMVTRAMNNAFPCK